jgi:hypothetical protein
MLLQLKMSCVRGVKRLLVYHSGRDGYIGVEEVEEYPSQLGIVSPFVCFASEEISDKRLKEGPPSSLLVRDPTSRMIRGFAFGLFRSSNPCRVLVAQQVEAQDPGKALTGVATHCPDTSS